MSRAPVAAPLTPGSGGGRDPALLAIARHGETEENAQGRWLGLRDSPLTETGRRQAMDLGERLKAEGPWAVIVTSPLGRAVATAALLAARLKAPVLAPERELREYDFGEWDGLTPAELRARGFWAAVGQNTEFAPPGGEGFSAAARRVGAALRTIAAAHTGQRVVVVTHGLTLAAGLALMLTGDVRKAPQYALPNGGLARLGVGTEAHLVAMDDAISCEIDL